MDTKMTGRFQQLESQLAEHPDGSLFVQLADAYRQSGEHERALVVLRLGLEHHGGFVDAYVMMGRVLMEQSRYPEAQVTFERVVELDPDHEEAKIALELLARKVAPPEPTAAQPEVIKDAAPPPPPPPPPPPAAAPPAASAAMPWEEQEAAEPVDAKAADVLEPIALAPQPDADHLQKSLLKGVVAPDLGEVNSTAIALADLLVGLLEYRDPFFRGGTSMTRLLTAAIARELKLPDDQANKFTLGAVLRDLGQVPLKGLLSKPGTDKLTAEGKRRVENHVDTALEMLNAVKLPVEVTDTIRYHHERFDGSGYPEGRTGESIPLGARIVALADSFAAMISARPHRLPHSVPAAIEEIKKTSGKQFDPALVEALLRVLNSSDWRGLRFGLRHHVLIVDPDETRAMVLATKLCSHGYLAEAAFDVETARERLNRSKIAGLVLSGDTGDLSGMLKEIRENVRLATLPILVTDAGVTNRVELLETGADVCLGKGSSFEELKATLEAFLRREGKSVSNKATSADAIWAGLQGEIQDFPLNWLMQVLNYDSRNAAIFLKTEDEEGVIFVANGNPKHARTKTLNGEPAFRHMLHWKKGTFTVDPEASSEESTIKTPLMNLLLDQAVQEDHAAFFGAVKT